VFPAFWSELHPWQWALVGTTGLVVGLAKTGLSGVSLLFVPLMAAAFGAKASTGLLLPMLCFGDLFGVAYYRRHADFKQLIRLMPWALAGLAAGAGVGIGLEDGEFKRLLAVLVLVCLALMVWQDRKKNLAVPGDPVAPLGWWFPALAGLAAGFTTMVGNAAGPVMTLFLLSMRLPKNAFIGTAAWFFLIINLVKVPLQIFFWHNMTGESVLVALSSIPFIATGAWLGLKLVGKMPERFFKGFVLVMTGVSALFLLL